MCTVAHAHSLCSLMLRKVNNLFANSANCFKRVCLPLQYCCLCFSTPCFQPQVVCQHNNTLCGLTPQICYVLTEYCISLVRHDSPEQDPDTAGCVLQLWLWARGLRTGEINTLWHAGFLNQAFFFRQLLALYDRSSGSFRLPAKTSVQSTSFLSIIKGHTTLLDMVAALMHAAATCGGEQHILTAL